jgi:LuxR family maltose regulon positive regulatory protein
MSTSRPVRRDPRQLPLTRAKLQVPNPDAAGIERPELLELLARHAGRPLTLVTADAGWGKTSLAAAFVRRRHQPVVWYGLLPSDGDLRVFVRHLLVGFRAAAPRFGGTFARLVDEPRPAARGADILGEVFAQALAELKGPPRLLLLDDLHNACVSADIVAFLDALLRLLPSQVRLLATSRTPPPLALERMRVRGELFELDAQRLRFTRDELRVLLERTLERAPSDGEVEVLDQASAGWPTAVQLALDALRREPTRGLDTVLADLRVRDLELQSFFSAEVYRRLEPAARELLECTSVLDRFDASLAAELSGQRDAHTRLDSLARRGLVRSFGTGLEASYEWHALVRAFVRQEVQERDGPTAWQGLETRAAGVLRRRGELERAVRHALDGREGGLANELLLELSPVLLRQGRAGRLQQLLDDAPAAEGETAGVLALARADALAALGRWDEAERTYERLVEEAHGTGSLERECRALLGLGKVLNLRGRHDRVLGMAERVLGSGDALPLELRVRSLQMKASAHFYLGQYRAAMAQLDSVRELLPAGADPELVLPTLHNLAIACASQGRYREASDWFRAALAEVRGSSSPRAPLYLSNLAFLHLELGDLVEARRAAEEGLAASQRFANRAQEATCAQALAECMALAGDLDGALASLKRAEELHDQLRMEVITSDLLAARGRIFCARGQYLRAVEFLGQAVERESVRPDSPRLTSFRTQLAWCELRAGRARAARARLAALLPAVERGENDDERMRAHWWLAEALLDLGERRVAERHLVTALALVRERGYAHFLRQRAREAPAPLIAALARGIEPETCAAALVEAGSRGELALLEVAERAATAPAEAALSVLAECGGTPSLERLPAVARRRRALAGAIRSAVTHIEGRARSATPRPEVDPAAPAARLVLFGPPRIELGPRVLPASAWRAQRAFHVLIVLTLRPRGASRDELLETFWPGRQLAAGRRNFHPTLSYIRSVLPHHAVPPLLRDVEVYRLNPDYPLASDFWEFERALEAARRATGGPERLRHLERALALAEHPPLEGLYGSWVEEVQNRQRDRVVAARIEAGALRRAAGDAAGALAQFRRAAELDEFNEATRVSVIECLIALGNRAAALAEYERLHADLHRALGVDPLPETEEALRKLLGRAGTGSGRSAQPQTVG